MSSYTTDTGDAQSKFTEAFMMKSAVRLIPLQPPLKWSPLEHKHISG